MPSKAKHETRSGGVLVPSLAVALPLWDDAQLQHEHWGGSLGLPSRPIGTVVEFRNTEGKIVVPQDEAQVEAFKEAIAYVYPATTEIFVDWKRPANIFAPFRPMVHRNATPFLSPYDAERTVYDGKAAEEAAQVSVAPTGKKGDGKSVVPPVPLHVQFPEILQVLDPQEIEGAVKEWEDASSEKVIGRYREIQPLMQAYDPDLELGCASTPAEACELRYTTAQRHRLNEVDAISKLSEPPLFMMDAFNSAITFMEHAQSYVKHGEYLWELVYPHAPGTCHPVYNPHGKYVVRLFIDGAFRRVTIDDYLPVDALGRPFLTLTSQKEIWPALLAKAIFQALGVNRHLLFTDPETIITCLWGEWVPQRVDPRTQPASACAFLLAYRRDLAKSDSNTTHFSASNTEEAATVVVPEKGEPVKQQKAEVIDDGATKKTSVTEFEGITHTDAPAEVVASDDATALPLCALGPVEDGKRRLFVIHEILLFRDTLAIHVSSNSPAHTLVSTILSDTSKDESVQNLLRLPASQEGGQKVSEAVLANQSTIWITFEELSAQVDLVVWRYLGEKSPFHFCNRLLGGEDGMSMLVNAKKKSVASTGATSFVSGGKKNIVRWIHVNSDQPEQLAFVSLSAFSLPVTPLLQNRSFRHSTASESRPLSVNSLALSVDSRTQRETTQDMLIDLYTWERGGALSRVGSFAYETGKLQCMVHSLPPGSHIFCLTLVDLKPQHFLSLLSTRELVVGEEKDALRSANIFKMKDAGSHMGVERANEEVIWFKRLITVKEPTVVSFVVSTLDPSEDPAAHRDVPASLTKEVKGAKVRPVNTKTPQKDFAEGVPVCVVDIPIIPHCHILLMNLDDGTVRPGVVGHLMRQQLEPNQQGYLVMAYVLIDSMSAFSFIDSSMSVTLEPCAKMRESLNSLTLDEKGKTNAREKPSLLYGKGNWKLTMSANRGFESYKTIMHNVFSFTDRGQLKRGSNALLFAYTCSVVERTYLTLILDLDTQDPIPFQVKVMRNGVEAPPVFVSETCTKHLFLPHVTLVMGEKARSTSYVVEAWLDETMVQVWEERRRMAQEMKFHLLRADAEQKAIERREHELDEYYADPRAFQERLEHPNVTQVEPVNNTLLVREVSVTSTRRGRVYADKRKHPVATSPPEKLVTSAAGSLTAPNSAFFLIDNADGELIVNFFLRLQFSSKADVKNGAPQKDPLATLRAGWVPPIEHAVADQGAGAMQRGIGVKGKQREAVLSAEDLLKADQGRLSRQRFLENPRNILFPYLTSEECLAPIKESARATPPKEQVPFPGTVSRVVLDVLEEANYPHAPILSESEYRIKLASLRAVEIVSPVNVILPGSASGPAQQRIKSPGERFSPRQAALPVSTFVSNAAAEEDTNIAELKAPLQVLSRRLTEDLKREHEKRIEGREGAKEIMREFWGMQQPGVAHVSLLGYKEEDFAKRQKSRQKG
ncbi:calpain-like cysteine peptidase [Trypanosoma rangeli]|uniref:Calpain-like cysteine peptidase n=1 Tax=Trypanosoma rangeli TaxID=5698 RepID=A0A3S5IQR2_TRYRA|nr:calpain-like cysteine peptidase [Trypanosoma rangeli]RNF01853.1 calpain-like cysteine peptidase [Trypanosoma rangeli]|eukprot:RNF01853.1 calpain-like cysteine peptidase [Trypanosoma rangeli]